MRISTYLISIAVALTASSTVAAEEVQRSFTHQGNLYEYSVEVTDETTTYKGTVDKEPFRLVVTGRNAEIEYQNQKVSYRVPRKYLKSHQATVAAR